MTTIPQTLNPREAAYLALLASLREERFISETLEQWQKKMSPQPIDFRFAQQVAYGASQMAIALDYLAEQLSDKKSLSLKQKERALMRIALYQYFFLDRVPIYAIANEMSKIARKYCHSLFIHYLNATLRKLSSGAPVLPHGDIPSDLSIRYSFPPFFVQELIKDYGLEKAKEVMAVSNSPAPIMARIRPGYENRIITDFRCLEPMCTTPCSVSVIKDQNQLPHMAVSSKIYIQNATPAVLMGSLCQKMDKPPKRILDLCASPGGKLIAAHDFFPKAALFANDLSQEKMERLSENCQKYGISVSLSCGLGEEFAASELFDVIILDVPCSNSGVLNKRPEARWRLSEASLASLEKTQLRLIQHAKTLMASDGVLWYMTCSILKKENEELIQRACRLYGLELKHQQTILPNDSGWDGGFACILK
jgi:16S rRNA (cytosine967-C5)-methyltransferase